MIVCYVPSLTFDQISRGYFWLTVRIFELPDDDPFFPNIGWLDV